MRRGEEFASKVQNLHPLRAILSHCGEFQVARGVQLGRPALRAPRSAAENDQSMPADAPEKPYRIVVGFDFSELSERALEEAFRFASLRTPAELHVITVAAPAGTLFRLPGDADAVTSELARETVRLRVGQAADEYQSRRGSVGVDRIAVYVLTGVTGDAATPITDLAGALEADLIVVGTHGRTGVSRFLLGSVAARVVRDATTSVHIVRPADLVRGRKPLPESERRLEPSEPHLKRFERHRTYHYVDKVAAWSRRTIPVS